MMDSTYSITLPHELIIEILLRLPVISLIRFKCVCKSWLSLISNPQFAKSHFDLAASPTNRILLNSTIGYQIESVDVDASSLHSEFAIVNLNFPPPPPPSEYTLALSDENNGIEILGSCKGFILSSNRKVGLIVWNPATGVHRRISEYAIELGFETLYGIGYDPSKDDYLIAHIVLDDPEIVLDDWQPRMEVFSLKTNSCYEIQGVNLEYIDLGHDFRHGLHLNESLHWLVISCDTKLHVIVALDLIKRSLFEIPVPDDLAEESTDKTCCLRIMRGCLSLCYYGSGYRGERTGIWVMKEYKLQSSWTKSFVSSACDTPFDFFFPICLTKGGGVFGSNGYGRLMKVNDKGELLEHRTNRVEDKLNLLHGGMYTESLLSLPSDSEEASENQQL